MSSKNGGTEKMNNKKGAIEWDGGNIVIIVSLIVLLIFGLLFIKIIFEKPEFRITEERCSNEKAETVLSPSWCEDFDFKIKSFDILKEGVDRYSLESYLCYEEVKSIENETEKIFVRNVGGNKYNETREVMCEYTLSHFEGGQRIDSYRNFTVFEYKPKDFEGLFQESLIVVDNETICNNNKFYGVYLEIIGYEKICEEVEFGKDIKLRADEKLYLRAGTNYISEEDLTIKWLERNCERRGFCNNKEELDCYEIIDNRYYKDEKNGELIIIPSIKFGGKGNYWSISKYQCDDYKVEVLR